MPSDRIAMRSLFLRTRFLHELFDFVKDFNRFFFFVRIQMGISIPCFFNIGMTEPPGDSLNVDTVIGKQGSMGVSEIMYTDFFQACSFGVQFIALFNSAVA